MNTTKVKLTTKHLLLVPISSKYREEIFKEFTKGITQFMFPQPSGDIKDIDNFISNALSRMKKGSNLQLVALNKKTKEFLGCVGLHEINKKNPEMGIWLKKTAHGHRYGQEAMKAVKEWADKNLTYDHIKYPVAVKNIASRKIPELLGGKAVREIVGKNSLGKKMKEVEYWIYSDKDSFSEVEMLDLIKYHFPKLKYKKAVIRKKGWDHDAILLDDKLLFRFPKDKDYSRFKKGVLLLQLLQKHTSTPLPSYKYVMPNYCGGAYIMLEGKTLTKTRYKKLSSKAKTNIIKNLAKFLTEIHSIPSAEVKKLVEWEPWGVDTHWKQDYAKKNKKVFPVLTKKQRVVIKALYNNFLKLHIPKPITFIHWDLSDDHIFINENTGKINGIIDFSDASIGDAALDFTWFWELGEDFVQRLYKEYKGKKDKDFLLRSKYYYSLMFVNILYYALDGKHEIALSRG